MKKKRNHHMNTTREERAMQMADESMRMFPGHFSGNQGRLPGFQWVNNPPVSARDMSSILHLEDPICHGAIKLL